MNRAIDVANWFLAMQDEDAGDVISNLKLQKLVYYAQGFHLAILDRALFRATIEAWAHGPVIPSLYHNYKKYGSGSIPPPDHFDFSIFKPDSLEVLSEVYSVFGQFSAWKLRNMTHEEPPWKFASEGSGIITHDSMKEYFKTQIS